MSILEKNIQALLSGVNEPLANKLLNFRPPTTSFFSMDENLNIYDELNKTFIYKNMHEEIAHFYEGILEKTLRYPFVCIYGIANALLIKKLSPHYKHVFVFEESLELFVLALSAVDLSGELSSGKIYLIDINEEKVNLQLRMLFDSDDMFLYLDLYEMFINHYFYEKYYLANILYADKISYENINIVIRNLDPDSKISLSCYENFLQNISLMLKNIPFSRIIDQNKGLFKSAIVVCAGPSLTKQLPLLKEYQEEFVIFCVDGAYPLLIKNNICPDYVLNLDFDKYPLEFFKDVNQKSLFILAASTHPSVTSHLHKQGVPLSLALNENLPYQNLHPSFGYLEFGTHVGHACYTLALALEFKNVILIGQDLSYNLEGNSHFKSFSFGADADVSLNIPSFKTVAYGGKGEVYTHLAWDDYKKKLEDLFARNLGVNFLNATEGGAKIAFTKELDFVVCCKKFANKNCKLKSMPKALTPNRSAKILNKIVASFKKEKENALALFEDSLALHDALGLILAKDRTLSLDFLKKCFLSIENFDLLLKTTSFLNDGVLKGSVFHKGKLKASLIAQKIKDEKTFLIAYIRLYKSWLELFIPRLEAKLNALSFFIDSI